MSDVTYSTATLGGFAASLPARLAGGKLRMRAGATTICDVALAATAADVSGVVLTLRGVDGTNPIGSANKLSGDSVAAGTIDNYQFLTAAGAVVWSSTNVAQLGLDTLVIPAAGRTIAFATGTHTVSNAP
jgi:hypothetical protein